MPELICKLLHIGKTTYYKYLKEHYPIITFLTSLKKEELEELLNSGKIKKFELIKNYTYDDLQHKLLEVDYDEDFYYANAVYKVRSLNIREQAIFYHAIKEKKIQTKTELLDSIQSIKVSKLVYEQFANIFKKKTDMLESRIGYDSDKQSLYEMIDVCMSEFEVRSFLKVPKFL